MLVGSEIAASASDGPFLTAQGIVPAETRGARIALLDETRGLLLLWMMLGHAAFQAGLPSTHWLLQLRLGPVTESFVMLTGTSVAMICLRRKSSDSRLSRTLCRRACGIAAIAYLSNIVFGSLRAAMDGRLSFAALQDIALCRTTWTISGILLGTALTLVLLAPLVRLAHRQHVWLTFVICALVGLTANYFGYVARSGEVEWMRHSLLFGDEVFGVSVGVLAGLGVWVFGGTLIISKSLGPKIALVGLTLASFLWYFLARGQLGWTPPATYGLNHFLVATTRFVLVFALVAVFESLPLMGFTNWIALLGRSSLLVFFAHRMSIQVLRRIFLGYLHGPALAIVLVANTAVVCGLLCISRERHPRISECLRELGL